MTKDLTQGKITPLLVKFTIPLLFGNIFQLMYNSVDSIIVGQLVGKEALAAVGTSNPLMTLAILFVNGMCIGASILMGTQYGAKKMDVLKRQISTTMIAGIVFSIAVTLFCILFARPLLLLIRVQEEVLPLAVSYLRIVFLGFIFISLLCITINFRILVLLLLLHKLIAINSTIYKIEFTLKKYNYVEKNLKRNWHIFTSCYYCFGCGTFFIQR